MKATYLVMKVYSKTHLSNQYLSSIVSYWGSQNNLNLLSYSTLPAELLTRKVRTQVIVTLVRVIMLKEK